MLQQEIDRHFEHLPVRTAEVFGEIDLDEERERLGPEVVDDAIAKIVNAFRWRLAIGQIDAGIVDTVNAMIARQRFPAYHYATFDVVRAHTHAERRRRHAPLGLTSCLDEAAIFSALALTLPASVAETAIVLGSPEHYTAVRAAVSRRARRREPRSWARMRARSIGARSRRRDGARAARAPLARRRR